MTSYLRRLLRAGAAYQLADAVSKLVALALLPVYTRHLTRADYGTAELVLTTIILFSIVLRLGLGEAFVRFHYLDADPERRRRLARTATGSLFVVTTLAAAAVALAAEPVSRALLGSSQPDVMRAAALGLWAFTNLELAYALLRVEERARAFATASLVNVVLTVGLTLWLVVGRDEGALGLLLGNYIASAVVLVGLWWSEREAFGLRPGGIERAQLGPMLRFGLPTVPAEVSVFALFFVDRFWLYRFESPDEAGLYSLSVKLAGIVVFTVRAFQYAWPPLAYSIVDDAEASRVYARITTYYVLFTGVVVAGLVLLGRWLVRLFAAPEFFDAHEALPWVSLGWALYGLFLVLVAMAGRAQVTVRNAPAALCGLVVNIALLALLVPPLGIAGAGLALAGA
jgi:O-antigen/teichoic acid export membrane protein